MNQYTASASPGQANAHATCSVQRGLSSASSNNRACGKSPFCTAAEVCAANTTGVSAVFAGGNLTLTAADGRNIVVAETITAGTAGAGGAALTGTGIDAAQTGTLRGTITLSASENIVMTGQFPDIGQANTISKDTTTLATQTVQTVASANSMIQRVDAALTTVSSLRSTFGAVQNRFESTIANLQTTSENLSASRSRIQDADFAEETAALTRAQILQQAGVAMLAQANALPQNVLSLLR